MEAIDSVLRATYEALAKRYLAHVRERLEAGEVGKGDVLLMGESNLHRWLKKNTTGLEAAEVGAVMDELVKTPAFTREWWIWCDHGCDDYYQADDEDMGKLRKALDTKTYHPAPYCSSCGEPAWETFEAGAQPILHLDSDFRDKHWRPKKGSTDAVIAAAMRWAREFEGDGVTVTAAQGLAAAVRDFENR